MAAAGSDERPRGGDPGQWMTVRQVAERLQVKPETVYAYASRGLLHSHRQPGVRESRFDRAQVERLASNADGRSGPTRGLVIESNLTMIGNGHFSYRGRDPIELAKTDRFESVAMFLWTGNLDPTSEWVNEPAMTRAAASAHSVLAADSLPLERLRLAVATCGVIDPFRHDLRTGAVVATTATLLATVIASLPQRSEPRNSEGSQVGHGIVSTLWSRLSDREPSQPELELVNAAMVLLADHELPPATLAARLIASSYADPYGVIATGMTIGTGTVIASSSLAVESYLYESSSSSPNKRMIAERLQSGEQIPGFGHLLYPDGDPRAVEILRLIEEVGDPERVAHFIELLSTLRRRGLPPPNVGFALGALAYATNLTFGAGEAIFGMARSVGWIAHAIEEYENRGHLPRQRAIYTGPRVEPASFGGY